MNTFFKKTAISIVVLGMTSIAFAGATHRHTKVSPIQTNGYFIGVEGLDLRAMNGDLDFYATVSNSSYHVHNISMDHDWGWRLFGGLTFGDNDDLTLSWFRLRSSSSEGSSSDTALRVRFIGSGAEDVSAKATFDIDEGSVVLGHTIHLNNPWSVRLAGGLTFARVDSDLRINSTLNNSNTVSLQPGIIDFSQVSKSRMRGWGPRTEVDVIYNINQNLALFAKTNASLLVAHRDVSFDSFEFITFEDNEIDFEYDFPGRNVVVPKLGMRLGVSYILGFGQAGGEGVAASSFALSAGWQVESYIHAIERYRAFDDIPNTTVSNFGDHGLFLGFTYSTGWM